MAKSYDKAQDRDMEQLYGERMRRYITAMRNEKPDMIPIRPFVAEFTAKYAGYTCQDVAHDYNKAFEAAVKCAKDFDWDAIVPTWSMSGRAWPRPRGFATTASRASASPTQSVSTTSSRPKTQPS
ncbi:MAG: uroporphyrinogen decarboxylase family protein [Planctomycetota bacterium]